MEGHFGDSFGIVLGKKVGADRCEETLRNNKKWKEKKHSVETRPQTSPNGHFFCLLSRSKTISMGNKGLHCTESCIAFGLKRVRGVSELKGEFYTEELAKENR